MNERAKVLGVPIDIVDYKKAMEKFEKFLSDKNCSMIVTPNSEIVMSASKDSSLRELITQSDLCIPDGIGLIYASKIHKLGLTERVTGIDFMTKILEYANEHALSIYILGGKPNVAKLACENIKKRFQFIKIKGYQDGYYKPYEEEKIIQSINKKQPDILFVALGAPKQENFIYKYKKKLKVCVAMGVGGSVDVFAGTVKRAPKMYQTLGLEWLYRLIKEPWRYKRMLALPKFMIKVLVTKH